MALFQTPNNNTSKYDSVFTTDNNNNVILKSEAHHPTITTALSSAQLSNTMLNEMVDKDINGNITNIKSTLLPSNMAVSKLSAQSSEESTTVGTGGLSTNGGCWINKNLNVNVGDLKMWYGKIGVQKTPYYDLDVVGNINCTGNYKINGVNFTQPWNTNISPNITYTGGSVGIGTILPS